MLIRQDALLQRTQLLEDSQNATKSAINKRRNVERMRGSSNINPGKVDDAITEMEEVSERLPERHWGQTLTPQANALEESLSKRLNAMSSNLHSALRSHSRQTHEDVALALLENAQLSIEYHKHVLRELEALNPDISRIRGTAALPPPITVAQAPPPISTRGGLPSSIFQPSMMPSQPYQPTPQMEIPKSMFPPLANHATMQRPHSAAGNHQAAPDPLSGHMAQSMMLPGNVSQRAAQTLGRNQGRKLERQAAKLLAGGF